MAMCRTSAESVQDKPPVAANPCEKPTDDDVDYPSGELMVATWLDVPRSSRR